MNKTKHLETKYSLAYYNLITKCDGDELKFYLYVKLYAINKNSAYPSQKSFKRDLGWSKYTTTRIAKKMEKKGRLKVQRIKGKNNIYNIIWYDEQNLIISSKETSPTTSQETLTTTSQETLPTTSQETLTQTISNITTSNKTIKYTQKDKENVELLHNTILERYPHLEKEFNFEKDCIEMNRLHRLDGWTYEQIESIARWSQQDDFWQQNILSVSKLRKQFNKLVIRAKSENIKTSKIIG